MSEHRLLAGCSASNDLGYAHFATKKERVLATEIHLSITVRGRGKITVITVLGVILTIKGSTVDPATRMLSTDEICSSICQIIASVAFPAVFRSVRTHSWSSPILAIFYQ